MVSLTKVSTSAECWRIGASSASAASRSGPSSGGAARNWGPSSGTDAGSAKREVSINR